MSLERVRETWTELGERDAFWAVLTGRAGAARKWKEEDFFRSGEDEITALLKEVPDDVHRDAALDFGCGAGRLTRALSTHFGRAVGVDISPAMIARAQKLNREYPRAEFVVNDRADLSLFIDESFDLVYSNITLQHMPPELSTSYIEEFFRVCCEGGMVIFQLPGEFIAPPPPRTLATEPLPLGGFRAKLSLMHMGDLRCAPGTKFLMIVRVRNDSNVLWPSRGGTAKDEAEFSIRVANHWRSRWLRRVRQFDDGRGELPQDLAPGEETDVGIMVTAPSEPGRYLLEFDMVQEHVKWFAERGSGTVSIPVRVDADMAPGTVRGLPPQMEMHGMKQPEVEALIERSGGEVVQVKADDAPGPEWTSFRYYARKR